VKLANSGSRTWKLKASVPTTTIIMSGMRSSGRRQASPTAARTWPRARAAGSAVWSSVGSISRSATNMARKVSALTAKHGAMPATAIRPPATIGPTIRALWTMTLFSDTALTTRSEPTSSMTKLWRVGLSTALTVPRASTSA
jgi:hypothetical protein